MVAAQSSRAPRTDCSRKHWSNLTSFRIITVGGGKRYDGLLTGSFSIYAGNKPLCCSGDIQGLYMSCLLLHCPVLLQKHILFLTCLWKQFASLKGRYFRCFVCSFLSCKYSALKKKKKIPDVKTKSAVVTDYEQQEWNLGVPGLSFMPKLNFVMHMMSQ